MSYHRRHNSEHSGICYILYIQQCVRPLGGNGKAVWCETGKHLIHGDDILLDVHDVKEAPVDRTSNHLHVFKAIVSWLREGTEVLSKGKEERTKLD